jgi:hypothetical protein
MPVFTREQVRCALSVDRANADAPKPHCHGIRQGLRVCRDLRDRLDLRVSGDLLDLPGLRVSKALSGLPAPRVHRVQWDNPAPNRIGIRSQNPRACKHSRCMILAGKRPWLPKMAFESTIPDQPKFALCPSNGPAHHRAGCDLIIWCSLSAIMPLQEFSLFRIH